jgi:hypothetical protein
MIYLFTSGIKSLAFIYLAITLGLYTFLAYRQNEREPNGATTAVLILNILSIFALLIVI